MTNARTNNASNLRGALCSPTHNTFTIRNVSLGGTAKFSNTDAFNSRASKEMKCFSPISTNTPSHMKNIFSNNPIYERNLQPSPHRIERHNFLNKSFRNVEHYDSSMNNTISYHRRLVEKKGMEQFQRANALYGYSPDSNHEMGVKAQIKDIFYTSKDSSPSKVQKPTRKTYSHITRYMKVMTDSRVSKQGKICMVRPN